MPVSARNEFRLSLDRSAFEAFKENGELLVELPGSDHDVRLVLFDEDLSAKVEADDEPKNGFQ